MTVAPVPALPPAAGPSSQSSSGKDGGEFGVCLAEHVGTQARAAGSAGNKGGSRQDDSDIRGDIGGPTDGDIGGDIGDENGGDTGTPVPQGLAALLGLVHGASAAAAVATLATVARGRAGSAGAADAAEPSGTPTAAATPGGPATDGTTPLMVLADADAGAVATIRGPGDGGTVPVTALAPAGKQPLVGGPAAPDQQPPEAATGAHPDTATPVDGELLPVATDDNGAGPELPQGAAVPATDAGRTGQADQNTADTPIATPVAAASAAPATGATGASTAAAAPQSAANPLLDQVTPVVSRMVNAGEGSHRMVLRLHPADLGEVHLTVTVRGEHVDVTVAAGAGAREVLSGGSSELRGLLDSIGRTAGQITFRDLPSAAPVAAAPSAASAGQQQPGQQQAGQPGTSLGDSDGPRQDQRETGHGDTSHAGAGARTDQQHAEARLTRTVPGRGALDVRI